MAHRTSGKKGSKLAIPQSTVVQQPEAPATSATSSINSNNDNSKTKEEK